MIDITISSFKCYDKTKKISFNAGELFHLTGPSGSGKSTILSAFEWCLFSPSNINVKPKSKKNGSTEVCIFFEDKNINIQRTLNELKVTLPSGAILSEDAGQGFVYSTFGDRNTWLASSLVFNGGRNCLLTGSGDEKLKILRNIAYGYELHEKDNPNFYLDTLQTHKKVLLNELKADRAVYSNVYDDVEKDLVDFENNAWKKDDRYSTLEEAEDKIKEIEKEIQNRISLSSKKENLLKTLKTFIDDKHKLELKCSSIENTDESLFEAENEMSYLTKCELEFPLYSKYKRFNALNEKILSYSDAVLRWKNNAKYFSLEELEDEISFVEKKESSLECMKQELGFLRKEIVSLNDEENFLLNQNGDLIGFDEANLEDEIQILKLRKKKAQLQAQVKKEFQNYEINPEKLLQEEEKKIERSNWEKEALAMNIPISPGLVRNLKDVILEREFQIEKKHRTYYHETVKYYEELSKEITFLTEKKNKSDEIFVEFMTKFYDAIFAILPLSVKKDADFKKNFIEVGTNFLKKADVLFTSNINNVEERLNMTVANFSKKDEDLASIRNDFTMDSNTYERMKTEMREKPFLPDHMITPEFVLKVENFFSREPPFHDEILYKKLKRGENVVLMYEKENVLMLPEEKESVEVLQHKICNTNSKIEKRENMVRSITENKSKILYILNKKDEINKKIALLENDFSEEASLLLKNEIDNLKNLQKDYFVFCQTDTEKRELNFIKEELLSKGWDLKNDQIDEPPFSMETLKIKQIDVQKKIKLMNDKCEEEKKMKDKISYLSSKIYDIEREIEEFSDAKLSTSNLLDELEEHKILCMDYIKYEIMEKRANDVCKKKSELEKKEKKYETHDKLFEIIKKISMEPIEDLIDTLNSKVNFLLDHLFEEPVRIEFSLHRVSLNASRDLNKTCVNLQIYLGENNHTTISTLSNGEADRISIALSLVLNSLTDSPVLFLDECMSTLETDVREKCLNAIKNFSIMQGKCVIDICHESVEGYYDKIINVTQI